MLDAMAAAVDARVDALVAVAAAETGLSVERLTTEVARTSGQLRRFAGMLREGSFLDVHLDSAPAGPDVRRMNVPLGAVGVFCAPDLPFACGVAGGGSAGALAAGCTVVVKAHELHPETAALTLGALRAGAAEAGFPEDVVQLVHGRDAGTALVKDARVAAIAFAGSAREGRDLHDLAKARPEPIPFYGEPRGPDPLVVTPGAAKARPAEIAEGAAASGLVLVPAGSGISEAMAEHVRDAAPQTLLGDAFRAAFTEGVAERAAIPGLRTVATGRPGGDRQVTAHLLAGSVSLLGQSELPLEECLGPMTVVLEYGSEDDLAEALAAVPGTRTITLHSEPHETGLAARLIALARDRADRLVFDSRPSAAGETGTAAITRFLRPVTYQDCPPRLLPPALRDENPWHLPRRVNGALVLP
jgi:NADP-dependent aldehyde dehydrogenase